MLAVPVGQRTYARMQRFEAHAVVVRVGFTVQHFSQALGYRLRSPTASRLADKESEREFA